MTEIIPVSFGARWGKPVCLVREKRVRQISGPAEAIRYMRTYFNERCAPAYSRAINVCFAALRCETDPDIAKEFFLAAYQGELEARRDH
ncbi:DUF982 domain-containing protein [Rhizobium terrae]|uniref:DUF982 domain-containing protein n=1 Tax=Rhizobium terrae TaxID=2171756 RepID=UPI000E3B64D6|nr:DUF982 domain-containing protein [Rhizobium terrae]